MAARTRIKVRVRVYHDDDTVVDLSDRVLSGPSRHSDIDMADWDSRMTFDNGAGFVNGKLSLDPFDELSTLNQDGDAAYDPLLTENHEVLIETDRGGGWVVFFQGYAGGSLDSVAVDTKRHTVTFTPDGVTMPLKERNRIEEITYSDRDLATSLLRSILRDSGFKGKLSHIVIADDPLAQIGEYTTAVGSTWDALQNGIAKTGYVLASRYWESGTAYGDGSGESTPCDGYYATLYDPIREKTVPDLTWTQECVKRNVHYTIDDVRTWVQVAFEDENGAQKHTAETSNPEARARFGIPAGDGTKLHRRARIVEGNNSLIRNLVDAEAYRDRALHDMESPSPDTSIDIDEFWDEPRLHNLVLFSFADYTINVGITGISVDLDPSYPWGATSITGVVDKVIGVRNYWLGQMLSEEEIAKRRQQFLEGGMARLPKPVVLHVRRYSMQGTNGETYSAINIHWQNVEAWWYGYTAAYISVGDNKHFSQDPFLTARGTYATLAPLPSGQNVFIKLRHFPSNALTPQGRR